MKQAFSVNIVFLILSLVGLSLLSRLPMQLRPSATGEALYVWYTWHGARADILEKEVTNPMEGNLAHLRGLTNISSRSGEGYGQISLEFRKGTNMDMMRFEISAILRSVRAKLPQGVSLPVVSYENGEGGDDPLLLSYTVNGLHELRELANYIHQHIKPELCRVQGVSRVEVSGVNPLEWELRYDTQKLHNLGLTADSLAVAIQRSFTDLELGRHAFEHDAHAAVLRLKYRSQTSDSLDCSKILVSNARSRRLYLSDFVTAQLKESKASSYFRVNGLNTINVVIYSNAGVNQVEVAQQLKAKVAALKTHFPPQFSMSLSYDVSSEIVKELRTTFSRALMSVLILLLFVLLVSRSFRYLLIICLSLLANLLIAVIFYYIFGIEIHLYSIAGITVSMGMVIDNTIVMADQIRYTGDRKAFLPILAATLTTIGALLLIFFLKEEQKANLIDFAWVMLINLSVSVVIALFFVPALMAKIPLRNVASTHRYRRLRRLVWFSRRYAGFLRVGVRWKWAFMWLIVWAFGLPFFMLPEEIKPENDEPLAWYASAYNATWGSSFVQSDIRPWVDKWLGGSLYQFSQGYTSGGHGERGRLKLYLNAYVAEGITLDRMNAIVSDFEKYLASFKEVEVFTCTIRNAKNARIEITFLPEYEYTGFPYQLKALLSNKAIYNGGIECSIYGLSDQGFSNVDYSDAASSWIKLEGYNYEMLLGKAAMVRDSLLTGERIGNVRISSSQPYWGNMSKAKREFTFDMNPQKLAEKQQALSDLFRDLRAQVPSDLQTVSLPWMGMYVPVVLRDANTMRTSVWDLDHRLNATQGRAYRLPELGTITQKEAAQEVVKENQVYQLFLLYSFMGPDKLHERYKEQKIVDIQNHLPLGFKASLPDWSWWNAKEKSQYWLLLLVFVVIFFISAILLESLWQAFAVVLFIPMSFVGLFLVYILSDLGFDQGGYAAMVMLSGLTVNAALYLINYYNRERVLHPNRTAMVHYIKAFHHKIVPILLTILSTIVGLIPFLLADDSDSFWRNLAAGSIGGLLVSVLTVVVWLPLLLIRKDKKS